MPLEPDFDNIDDLDPNNPFPDDPVSEGDDHLRGIKSALQGNVTGDDTETRLLVAGLVQALVEATGMTVQGTELILDNRLSSDLIESKLLTLDGGWTFTVTGGSLFIRQSDPDGVSEGVGIQIGRDGAVSLRYNNVIDSLRTADAAIANSAAEVKDAAGALIPVGFNVMPTDVGGNAASFTLLPTQNGRRFRPNATITITVNNLSLPLDGAVVISNQGAGTVTLLGAAGAQFTLFLDGSTAIVPSFTMTQGQVITLMRVQSSLTYEVWGSFVAP